MTDIYNLYCDESRHTSDINDHYAIIGALQCLRADKHRLVHRIHSLMALHNAQGELGWKRLSPNRQGFYHDILELFVNEPNLSFRCIVIDRPQLDHDKFNEGDAELGFYKLYYQMLVHWLKPGNRYHIYLDWQQNASTNRFNDLRTILMNKLSGRARIDCLEPVTSHTQPLIQLADLLMGAVGYQCNGRDQHENASRIKVEFIRNLADALGRESLSQGTSATEQKFNVFTWQGRS